MSKILFSVIEDEKLVEMVAKFDCLYDLASPLYKNQLIKDNAWREIAEQINRSGKNIVIYYNLYVFCITNYYHYINILLELRNKYK